MENKKDAYRQRKRREYLLKNKDSIIISSLPSIFYGILLMGAMQLVSYLLIGFLADFQLEQSLLPSFALTVIIYFGWKLYRIYSSRHWHEVTGMVQFSTVNNEIDMARYRHDLPMYYPEIRYEYTYKDHRYMSSNLNMCAREFRMDFEDALEMADRYPKKSSIQVWVNPDRPEHSVIFRFCTKERIHAVPIPSI